MIRRLLRAPALLALPLALVAGACTERLQTADGCPVLCPGQSFEVLDTILDPAIVFDTTLGGFPLQGYESPLVLASRGDSLDVRPVIRFDTLTRFFTPSGDTSRAVTRLDSLTLKVRLTRTSLRLPATFFVDAYDVGDSLAPDSIPTALLPHFVPARLLGTVQVDSAALLFDTTTVTFYLDTAKVMAILRVPNAPLRIGLRVRAASSVQLYVTPSDDATHGPRLRYRVSPDTAIPAPVLRPSSATPVHPQNLNGDLLDYHIVAAGPDPRKAGRFGVGGMPAVRSYLRFNLPRRLTDSTAVLRAQLELVQDPLRGVAERDSVTIRTQLVLAGYATTDLSRAARLLAPAGYFVGDSIRVAPGDSGTVRIEINALFRAWRTTAGLPNIPSALVLRSDFEGFGPQGARFFGVTAPPGLRPRIRVSYVPNIKFGQP